MRIACSLVDSLKLLPRMGAFFLLGCAVVVALVVDWLRKNYTGIGGMLPHSPFLPFFGKSILSRRSSCSQRLYAGNGLSLMSDPTHIFKGCVRGRWGAGAERSPFLAVSHQAGLDSSYVGMH